MFLSVIGKDVCEGLSEMNERESTRAVDHCQGRVHGGIPMRWSFILSRTGSMSSQLRLLEPTKPLSIPNIPPKPPPFLEL